MKTLTDAVREAVRYHRQWLGGAVIVRDGDDYDAVPGAYLTDISYIGPREVVADVIDLCDWAGPEAYDASERNIVSFMVDAITEAA